MSVEHGEMSLKDALAAVNTALDARQNHNKPLKTQKKSKSAKLDELSAFRCLDPLLDALHCDFMTAKGASAQAVKEFGADSPMAEIACEAEDSAWCAMQTRLLEVRGDRALMRRAQDLILESEREEEQKHEKREIEKTQKIADHIRVLNTIQTRAMQRKCQERKWSDLLAIYVFFFHRQFLDNIIKGPRHGFGMATV